jgi:hypothetical protein
MVLAEIQTTLERLNLARSQYEFSRAWLGKSQSYYSSIKARKREPSVEALVKLAIRLGDTAQRYRDTRSFAASATLNEHYPALKGAEARVWDLVRKRSGLLAA